MMQHNLIFKWPAPEHGASTIKPLYAVSGVWLRLYPFYFERLNMKLKCLFGRHNYIWQWKIKYTQQNVWKCSECGCYYIQHYGFRRGYKTKILPDYAFEKELIK